MYLSQINTVEVLTPTSQDVTVFGDNIFKEVIKIKWGHMGGPKPI